MNEFTRHDKDVIDAATRLRDEIAKNGAHSDGRLRIGEWNAYRRLDGELRIRAGIAANPTSCPNNTYRSDSLCHACGRGLVPIKTDGDRGAIWINDYFCPNSECGRYSLVTVGGIRMLCGELEFMPGGKQAK